MKTTSFQSTFFRIIIGLTLSVFIMSSVSRPAIALTGTSMNSLQRDTTWYESEGSLLCTDSSLGDGTHVPTGGDTAETAFLYFIQRGFTPEQTAGILGNFFQESSMNPKAENPSSGAYGLAQWLGSRKDKLMNRDNYDTVETQLRFVWFELQGDENVAYDAFQATRTAPNVLEAATEVWMKSYERPGVSEYHLDKRIANAQKYLKLYGGKSAGTSSGGNASCGINTPGENTRFVDGFTVYDQCDPAWGNKSYSSSTICASGCGPAAMAMVISTFLDRRVTPLETSNYAASQGMYIPGTGSSWQVTPVLAEKYGLKAKTLPDSIDAINRELRSGALIVTSGAGPVPFTSAGHFIVIRAVTDDGKWMVGDSAHTAANNQEWDPQEIFSNMRRGNVWAVTK